MQTNKHAATARQAQLAPRRGEHSQSPNERTLTAPIVHRETVRALQVRQYTMPEAPAGCVPCTQATISSVTADAVDGLARTCAQSDGIQ